MKLTTAANFMISDIISTATGAVQSSLVLILAGSRETWGGADVSALQLSTRLFEKREVASLRCPKSRGNSTTRQKAGGEKA